MSRPDQCLVGLNNGFGERIFSRITNVSCTVHYMYIFVVSVGRGVSSRQKSFTFLDIYICIIQCMLSPAFIARYSAGTKQFPDQQCFFLRFPASDRYLGGKLRYRRRPVAVVLVFLFLLRGRLIELLSCACIISPAVTKQKKHFVQHVKIISRDNGFQMLSILFSLVYIRPASSSVVAYPRIFLFIYVYICILVYRCH